MGVESYKHKFAKTVLTSWLRGEAAAVGYDNHADFCGIKWRPNRRGPHWGIWEEYPILASGGGLGWNGPVWDECEDRWADRPPTFDELCADNMPPVAIFDVAVQHKGNIRWAFEVVHKNEISPKKLEWLQVLSDDYLNVGVIQAEWILRQVGRPKRFAVEWVV